MDTNTLIALNVVAYASAVAGIAMFLRTPRRVEVYAFGDIVDLLRAKFPELPQGFTLREGLARARTSEPGLNWDEINSELSAYEGHRYGRLSPSEVPGPALSKLVSWLRGSSR